MARNTLAKVLKNPSKLLENPTPGAVLGVAALAALAGWGIYEVVKEDEPVKKKKKADGTPDRAKLSGVYAENASLGNSPGVMNAVKLPIVLGPLGAAQVRDSEGGVTIYKNLKLEQKANGVTANGKVLPGVSWKNTLEHLVTNLTAEATSKGWNIMKQQAQTGKKLTAIGADLDQAVLAALKAIVPKMDWSKGLQPYGLQSPEASVWAGLILLATLAGQSYKKTEPAPRPTPADDEPEPDDKPDGWPTDEELPDDEPIPEPLPDELTPAEQTVVDGLKQKLNGRVLQSIQGPGTVKYAPQTLVLLDQWLLPDVVGPDSNAGFSAMMAIYEDDVTRATGEHLGIAIYDSNTDDGAYEFRGNKSATVPNAEARVNALAEKLVGMLVNKQVSL